MQLPQIVSSNKLAFGVGGAAVLALMGWLAFGYFGIQAAFIDDVVDEAGPVFSETVDDASDTQAAPTTTAASEAPAETAEPTADEPAAAEPEVEAAGDDEAEVEAPAEEPAEPEIITLFDGDFSSLNNYSVSGDAFVLNNGTEQRFLRFENFDSSNGPDLKVYLRADNGDFISLGDLSGNIGNQNYEIPVDVDLSVYRTVEIWCERFSRGFGEATLSAVS